MSLLPGRRCLGDEISEYAAGRLDPRAARERDLHLVACQTCRAAVEQERRLQAAISGAPVVPAGLRSSLLSLAATVAASGDAVGDRPDVPPVPRAPLGATAPLGSGIGAAGFGSSALPVVAPGAPALHRSALRSAVVATAVAGASAAAALGLGVTSSQAVSSGTARPATPVSSSSPGVRLTSSGFAAQQLGSAAAVGYRRTAPQPAMLTIAPLGAQSTP